MASRKDFFVSYAGVDRPWAVWIAWQLEAGGYQVVVQAWDFGAGRDWVHEMQDAMSTAKRIVAVLSPEYLRSDHSEAEWRDFYARDPSGRRGLLLPVRVRKVNPLGLLRTRVYVDLVGLDAIGAREALMAAARGARGKPLDEPEFPDPQGRSEIYGSDAPRFPGDLPTVPENTWRAAQSAGLTTDQLRTTAAAIADAPQLATERGRNALFAALQSKTGAIARTDDPDADLLALVSAVLDRQASDELSSALLDLASSEAERIAAVRVRHRWELQVAVRPLLGSLQRIPGIHLRGALAGTLCDVPRNISDVDKVLELLADRRISRSGAPALAEFIVRLQRRRPDLQIPAGWFSDQGLDESAVAALNASVAAEAGVRRKLVIDLSESRPIAWQLAVTGYLGPGWCERTEECEAEVDGQGRPVVEKAGVQGAVFKIVEWARSQAADFTIGFLLRHSMLCELPERWEYEDAVIRRIPLSKKYPVVLHTAERMIIPELQPAWDSKLAAIEASMDDPPSVLWLHRDEADVILQGVHDSHDTYVALTFVPEVRPDPRTTAVWSAIAEGAPYVVWVETSPADGYNLRKQLRRMLRRPIKDFPAALQRLRAADPYLSGALRVIWDQLDELPPYLERLGEELVSNG
jgi:hypothetical protein